MSDNNRVTSLFQHVPVNEPQPLCSLAYVSTQTRKMSVAELLDLLNEAQRLNEERGLTGLLLHKDGCFFQILEGDPDQVARTFDAIEADPRHKDVQIILEDVIEFRDFSDWRMGFMDLDGVDLRMLDGFSDFLQVTETPRDFLVNLSQGHHLAMMFKQLGA